MLFNSFPYMVFFPSVAGLYFLFPHRFRWALLLAASYFFYMCWEPGYALLIATSTLVDYLAGLLMGRHAARAGRRKYLVLSLCVNLGLLGFFKYYNFFNATLRGVLAYWRIPFALPDSDFLLPVGISFYTFQTLSYTIEVYRGHKQPEKHLGIFALYVAFFPQLVAGPIERARNLLPQFFEQHAFDYQRVTDGLKLMAWGLFKKIVVADRLAVAVDTVYGEPQSYAGPGLTLATVFFAFQVYCDFSGYSDMAIGAAQVLGFRLMDNFRRPYFATSVRDFWRRWHISLSTWFRDYLYIPLGGSRASRTAWVRNILVVFLLAGLWHGANWTFIAWGGLHAVYMIVSRATDHFRADARARLGLDHAPRTTRILQTLTTFVLVTFAWIFFRAADMADARHIVTHLNQGWGVLFRVEALRATVLSLGLTARELLVVVGALFVIECGHVLQRRESIRARLARQPMWFRWAAYSALLWSLVLFGVSRSEEFIYFMF